jgi:hypothetical protein
MRLYSISSGLKSRIFVSRFSETHAESDGEEEELRETGVLQGGVFGPGRCQKTYQVYQSWFIPVGEAEASQIHETQMCC